MTRDTDAEARALISTDEEQLETTKLYAQRRTAFILAELDRRGLLPVYEGLVKHPASQLDWSIVGVSEEDVARAAARGVERSWLHRVFCHRDLVQREPRVLAYYRNLAGISAKTQARTLPHLYRIETGSQQLVLNDVVRGEMTDLNAVLRRVLNEPLFNEKVIDPLLFVSEGASIDGAWRNIIGKIAVWETVRRLVALLQANDQFVRLRVGRRVEGRSERHDEATLANTKAESLERDGWIPLEIEGRCSMIELPSNPDVEIFRRAGHEWATVAAGEIKGATDPANVWERWPLVIKTLDDIKSTRPSADRFFIGLTITENLAVGLDRNGQETRRGIKQLLNEGLLARGFSLSKLLTADTAEEANVEFAAYFGKFILCDSA